MHPELQDFLEKAFDSITSTDERIGRVVVEPDYEIKPEPRDSGHVAQELTKCLSSQSIDESALTSHEGLEANIPDTYKLLKTYVRRITLHADTLEGSWVEVAPPGNWI